VARRQLDGDGNAAAAAGCCWCLPSRVWTGGVGRALCVCDGVTRARVHAHASASGGVRTAAGERCSPRHSSTTHRQGASRSSTNPSTSQGRHGLRATHARHTHHTHHTQLTSAGCGGTCTLQEPPQKRGPAALRVLCVCVWRWKGRGGRAVQGAVREEAWMHTCPQRCCPPHACSRHACMQANSATHARRTRSSPAHAAAASAARHHTLVSRGVEAPAGVDGARSAERGRAAATCGKGAREGRQHNQGEVASASASSRRASNGACVCACVSG
jgi:hypothetical protein